MFFTKKQVEEKKAAAQNFDKLDASIRNAKVTTQVVAELNENGNSTGNLVSIPVDEEKQIVYSTM